MKEITEMPTDGQFVAVWLYDGEIWSNTYRFHDGITQRYCQHSYSWVSEFFKWLDDYHVKYFIAK